MGSPLVVSDCQENSRAEANITLPSEPNCIASKTSTENAYVNAPASRLGHVLSRDLAAPQEKRTLDDGVYLEPRKIMQF